MEIKLTGYDILLIAEESHPITLLREAMPKGLRANFDKTITVDLHSKRILEIALEKSDGNRWVFKRTNLVIR